VRRERHWVLAFVGATLSLLVAATGAAQTTSYIFTPIDVPKARDVELTGINNAGQIVGYYSDDSPPFAVHGLLYSGGNLTVMDLPAFGINNIGQIVVDGGFLNSDGSFTPIGLPPEPTCCAQTHGINDAGQIVGSYIYWNQTDAEAYHGFLYSAGNFTTIDAPGADPFYGDTIARGINNFGQIVGTFDDGNNWGSPQHGFLFDTDGRYTTIDPPGSSYTRVFGINNAGQILGSFIQSQWHGFLYIGGSITLIDVPGALSTSAFAINDAGQIVGQYWDSTGIHGFVATPAKSPGLARLLGGRSTNQTNILKGGSNVFTSPAKSGR
jgi:probable HAF family extracellular repeat protein